jgi:hypothetical protein
MARLQRWRAGKYPASRSELCARVNRERRAESARRHALRSLLLVPPQSDWQLSDRSLRAVGVNGSRSGAHSKSLARRSLPANRP